MPNTIPAAGEAMLKGPTPENIEAWQNCRALGNQLSEALAATDDVEYALVRPAGNGFSVTFASLSGDPRMQSDEHANLRLGVLLSEVAATLHYHPGLKIERIAINEHGVHTFHKIPGGLATSEEAL